MGISYDPTKPAANDKPTNDQAPMQTNFASIKTLIDVDHVDFSNSNYGMHKQVTLPTNNAPAIGGGGTYLNSYLFTGKQSPAPAVNLNQLFFYPSGATAAQSSGQYNSTSTGGSAMLLGGIIVKWGTSAAAVRGNSISFVNSFPNACFGVQLVYTGASSIPILGVSGTPSNSAFTFNCSIPTGVPIFYLAIGN